MSLCGFFADFARHHQQATLLQQHFKRTASHGLSIQQNGLLGEGGV
jgi:hypothetical protein